MATLEKRAYDGDQARAVLDNEAFIRAFTTIEEEHVQAWKDSPARDRDGRESLWTTVKLLHKLKGMLEAAMEDGKLARIAQEHQERILAEDRREGLNVAGMR